jgi:hypothetical protein
MGLDMAHICCLKAFSGAFNLVGKIPLPLTSTKGPKTRLSNDYLHRSHRVRCDEQISNCKIIAALLSREQVDVYLKP